MLEPSAKDLMSCAADSVIIIINATCVWVDAIIVSRESIRLVELPEMRRDLDKWSLNKEIQASSSTLMGFCDQGRDVTIEMRSTNSRLSLEWLWHTCIKLVLQEINGNSSHSQTGVPHVWWLGTGMAAWFPFHAAGCYKGDFSENSLQQMIPSYTPLIRALAHSCLLLPGWEYDASYPLQQQWQT